MTIDPIAMARFLVLPGASELLEAFSRIPPGELRSATVLQVQAIANAHSMAPPDMQMADPLMLAAQRQPKAAAALPPPKRKPATSEEQVVAKRLAGVAPAEIANELQMRLAHVSVILRDARKAGVKFPHQLTKGHTKPKSFPLDINDLDPRGAGAMRTAAFKRGKSLEDWMAARARFIELRKALTPMDEIASQLGIEEDTLWSWLYAARGAGIDVPARLDFDEAEFTPTPPPPAPPVLTLAPTPETFVGKRVFPAWEAMNAGARGQMKRAADARGMTVQSYLDLRESVVQHRLHGKHADEIMQLTGQTYNMVKDTLQLAVQQGVTLPYLPNRRRKVANG